MAQHSLYRRYRPRRFSEIRGQGHIVRALQNAIATDTTGHAYLFSGPRGTGKTTTARILAKALNCTDLQGGEPCGICESCVSMDAGSSYDLFELDAASNNGVDAMRDLISRAAVGSPGRTKVYILDEVHMLSAAASNALLKTLEEPPDHVTFVLATTDPQKVLPTIRSRTQHYEFSLLSAAQLEEYVRWIIADADLSVDDAVVAHVIRAGRGSARDTLSALDQAVAAGGVADRPEVVAELLGAVSNHDTARALVAVATAIDAGRDPRGLGEGLLGSLRDAFLVALDAPAGHLGDADRAVAAEAAAAIGAAGLTRALELLGAALIDMRQAADPRIPLEVALVRITDASTDTTLGGLAERVGRLEREVARGVVGGVAATGPATDEPRREQGRAPRREHDREQARATETPTTPQRRASAPQPAASPRPAVADIPPPPRRRSASPPPPPSQSVDSRAEEPPRSRPSGGVDVPPPASSSAAPPAAASRAGAPTGVVPTLEQLTGAMSEVVLPQLKAVARAVYAEARLVGVENGSITFAFANDPMRQRAERSASEVQAALTSHFAVTLTPRFVVGDAAAAAPRSSDTSSEQSRGDAPPPEEDPSSIDLSELTDATDIAATGAEKLTQAFPGAVIVEDDQ